MLRVRVSHLAMDPTTQAPVVLLEAPEESGLLPIWIGPYEAQAIARQLEGEEFERPLTHDLLRSILEGFEVRVQKVTITELRGNTFFAKIYLVRDDEVWAIDARPSDSIALALGTRAPLYVDPKLFRENAKQIGLLSADALEEEERDEDDEEDDAGPALSDDDPLKKYLDDLDPPDDREG